MTRYLVFDSQADAQSACDSIDTQGRLVYHNAGYTVDDNGDIVGKRDGEDNPQVVTTTWDIPRQRLDGKWLVSHPETFVLAAYEVSSGVTVEQFVLQGITAPIEEWQAAWWPYPSVS